MFDLLHQRWSKSIAEYCACIDYSPDDQHNQLSMIGHCGFEFCWSGNSPCFLIFAYTTCNCTVSLALCEVVVVSTGNKKWQWLLHTLSWAVIIQPVN